MLWCRYWGPVASQKDIVSVWRLVFPLGYNLLFSYQTQFYKVSLLGWKWGMMLSFLMSCPPVYEHQDKSRVFYSVCECHVFVNLHKVSLWAILLLISLNTTQELIGMAIQFPHLAFARGPHSSALEERMQEAMGATGECSGGRPPYTV